MTHDRDLITRLDDLESFLPKLIEKHTVGGALQEDSFWPEFAGIADSVVDSASPADHDYAAGRVQCMLKNAELIPGEDEGEPCA